MPRSDPTLVVTRSQISAAFKEWHEMDSAAIEVCEDTTEADFFMLLLRKHGAR